MNVHSYPIRHSAKTPAAYYLSLFAAVACALLVVLVGDARSQTWSGSAANDVWSTGGAGGNWTGAAAPVAGGNVGFNSTDAQANSTTINNIVDTSRTIGSLRYTVNGASLWQNTQINSGATLNITGSDGARSFGLGSANAGALITQVTISGAGTLSINSAANIRIGEGLTGAGNSNSGTLDMSGLATFSANLPSNNLFIGAQGGDAIGTWLVNLANTSTITSSILHVGGQTLNPGTSTLKLGGGTQTLNVNTINVGSAPAGGNRGSGEISSTPPRERCRFAARLVEQHGPT